MNEAKGQEDATQEVQSNNDGPNDQDYSQERLKMLLEKMEPYRKDLLYRGSIQRLFNLSVVPTYVLKFRQRLTGTRDGRQKTLYIGTSKALRDKIENILWQWRREAGTMTPPVRVQPGRDTQPEHSTGQRTLPELLDVLKKGQKPSDMIKAVRELKKLYEQT